MRQRLSVGDEDALVALYARGYWLARYIEETQPGLLKELLSGGCQHKELERRIAGAYGKRLVEFWGEIDEAVVSHFGERREADFNANAAR